MKFNTTKATVSLAFSRQSVVLKDVLEALDQAKRQAEEEGMQS